MQDLNQDFKNSINETLDNFFTDEEVARCIHLGRILKNIHVRLVASGYDISGEEFTEPEHK